MADNSQSLFASFKAPPPAPAPPPAQAGPSPEALKVQALEKAVAELKAELAKLREKPAPLPPSSVAEAAADRTLSEAQRPDLKTIPEGIAKTLAAHLDRAWDAIEAYKAKAAAQDIKLGGAVKLIEEIYARAAALEQQVKGLPDAQAHEELKRRFAAAEERLAKSAPAEEIKRLEDKLAAQDERLNNSAAVAPAEAILSMKAEVAATGGAFEEMKRKFSFYLEEFSSIERECRSSLGAVKGYVEKAESSPALERLDGLFRDSLGKLEAKLADAEVTLHEAVAAAAAKSRGETEALAARLAAARQDLDGEVLPALKTLSESQAAVTKDSQWLKEEYSVRVARQLRALEARYDAVAAVGKRVADLAADLEKLRGHDT